MMALIFLLAGVWAVPCGAQQMTDASAAALVAKKGYADQIVVNGKIVSVEDTTFAQTPGRIVQAMAIKEDRVMALGTNDWIRKLANAGTRVIDVKGKTVIPGTIATHAHLYNAALGMFGKQVGIPDLENVHRLDTVVVGPNDSPEMLKEILLARIKEATTKYPPGDWINIGISGGERANRWAGRAWTEDTIFPVREDLDRVAPNHPVQVRIGVRGYVNSKGLEASDKARPGYSAFIDQVDLRDATRIGRTGLNESTTLDWEVWMRDIPLPTIAEMLRLHMELIPSLGITTVGTGIPHPKIISGYSYLHRIGRMPIRFGVWMEPMRSPTHPYTAAHFYELMGSFAPAGDNYYWIMGMGSERWDTLFPEQCMGPDLEAPKVVKDTELCPTPQGLVWQQYQNAVETGWRPGATHAVGSDGARRFIQMLEMAMKNRGLTVDYIRDLRPTGEHCITIGALPDIVAKWKEYNFYLGCDPTMLNVIPSFLEDYGPQGERFVLPIKTWLDNGIKVVGQTGTDPFWGMYLMVTRNLRGRVFQPQQRVDRITALKMYTIWAAEFMYKEKEIGSLETGKLADYLVLNRDYLTIPEEEIPDVQALLTAIGGEVKYLDRSFAQELGMQPVGPATRLRPSSEGGGRALTTQ
ncbi:MAG: amidohydrolase family protein [Acidobacteria bacterium]|nr:amidohydrolase family protein [Acidobacteriota bacterium]